MYVTFKVAKVSNLPTQPNRSLLEGIEVLLAVARKREAVGVRPLARELGLTPTRLQRYLATLAHSGILKQRPDRRYTVGSGIHALSAISLSASGLASRAMKVLPDLADPRYLVALGILWRDSVSYLYFDTPQTPPANPFARVEDYPARDSVIGRVLMAAEGTEEESEFGRELQRIRKRGYASLPRPDGHLGLAVPVGTPAVAGLAIEGAFAKAEIPPLVQRLQEVAEELQSTGVGNGQIS